MSAFTRRSGASPSRRSREPHRNYRPEEAPAGPTGPISIAGSIVHLYDLPAANSINVPAGVTGNARVLIVRNFQHAATVTAVSGGGPPSSGTGQWARIAGGTTDGSGSVREIWLGRINSGSTTISVTYSSTPATLTELMSMQLASVSGTGAVWARVGTQSGILDTGSTTTPPFPSLTATATGQCYVGHMAFWGTGSPGTTTGFTYYSAPNNNVVAFNPGVPAGAIQPTAVQTPSAASYAIGVLITDGT